MRMSRPFYDKVARDIGMSGDAKAEEIWRPAGDPYPMPPMKTFRHGEIWLKGFESLGIRMVPAPVAMNSTEYKGRPACIYDGWCHVGCPTGALANPLVTYLGEARKANAEVRALCTVTRVLTNPQGTKVTGVEYYDEKKQRQVQEASVVVLAAWSGAEPAHHAQLGDRQASQRARQRQRARRQIHDGAFDRGDCCDVRRGHPEPPGHHRRAVHVLRPLRQDQLQGRVRQHLHHVRRRRKKTPRLRQLPAPTCSAPSCTPT